MNKIIIKIFLSTLFFVTVKATTTTVEQDFAKDPAKALNDMALFVGAIGDTLINRETQTFKFVLPTQISFIGKGIVPLFDLLESSGRAGSNFIGFIKKDLPSLTAQFKCLSFSNQELGKGTHPECMARGCRDKKTCVASSIRESLKVLRPFVHDFLGKILSIKTLSDGSQDVILQRGIMLSLDDLAKIAAEGISKVGGLSVLGDSGSDLLEKTQEMLVKAGRVEEVLAIALNELLDALDLVALVIGGPDSLPDVKPETRELVRSQHVKVSDDF